MKYFSYLISSIIACSISIVWTSVYAVNGQCGTLASLSVTNTNQHPWASYFFCDQWETEWINFSSNQWAWTCKGTDGDSDANCTYTTINSPYTGTCSSANSQSFSTTINNVGDYYSNINNKFLSKLCKTASNLDLLPTNFSSNALGWTRTCPGSSTTCQANHYFDARCGIAANSWHMTAPANNLCSPGYNAWPVQFDNERYTRSRQCSGGGWGNSAYCNAWLNGENTFAPVCNTSIISTNSSSTFINGFPWNNACIYGIITNWQLSLWWIATRQCNNNGQLSNTCGNVTVANYSNGQWNSCNSSISNQTFDSTYKLLQNSLCEDGGIASSFTYTNGRWKWKCGIQSCEALTSNKPMCWWATKQPRRSYPTNGICTEWIASTIKQSNSERWWICTTNLTNVQKFNNSSCTTAACILQVIDFYNGKTTLCSSPRITDGECKVTTQMNINGFSDPDEVLQAGLCESWIPDPLIPIQDTTNKKRSWQCKSTSALWTNSPQCYAKVKLPTLSVIYQPQSSNGSITAISAIVTGFNNVYISFDDPLNQYYKLFTQNGYFFFKYHDRAGNTWSVLAVVDSIQTDVPTAKIIQSPSTATSGNVIVSLTWFNRSQTPVITFSGTCLSLWTCVKNSSINPYLFTVTFTNNGTGYFQLTDQNGVPNMLPVVVNTIDRIAPLANLSYDNPNPTNTGVTVSIINPNEAIKILNNNWSTGYYFTGNGSFVFQMSDTAGNINYLTATVNWINKNAPTANIIYSTTGTTTNNVVATLTNFSTSGIVVTNNSWSISYTFSYNRDFIFVLKDPAGNIWSVKAHVDWINKPITNTLINNYEKKLCPDRTGSPVDTSSQLYNYYIQTVINNCLMKSSQSSSNHYRYFYPNKTITRGEFLTVVGRMMKQLSTYSGSLHDYLSPNYIGITYKWIDESLLGEVDTWWLLMYSPLIKQGNKWTVESKKPINGTEAQKILEQALIVLGDNTTKSSTLIKNSGNISRAQTAYAIGKIVSQYNTTALGNHHLFLKQLNIQLNTLSWSTQQQSFVVQLIKKIKALPSQTLYRVWLDRDTLLQDLSSIALWTLIERKSQPILDLKTVTDFLITKNTSNQWIINSDKTYLPTTTNTTSNQYFNFWSDISF